MDVWRISITALRRWYILLPLLALTAFAAYAVGQGVRPQYEVNATAILVPGAVRSEISSPYGSMDSTNTVLAIVLGNIESRTHIADMGLDPDYQVSPQSRSTIMRFSVVSDSPEIALATGEEVLELARQELAARQEGVGIPSVSQIGLDVLQPPNVDAVVTDGKMRNMAVVGLLGGAVSLIVVVLFDDMVGLARRWAHRRRVAPPSSRAQGTADSSGLEPSELNGDGDGASHVGPPGGRARDVTEGRRADARSARGRQRSRRDPAQVQPDR